MNWLLTILFGTLVMFVREDSGALIRWVRLRRVPVVGEGVYFPPTGGIKCYKVTGLVNYVTVGMVVVELRPLIGEEK